MRIRIALASFAALFVAASGACTSSTELLLPLEGQLLGQVIGTQGRPFGLGIARTGRALVLQLDRTTAGRFDMATDSVGSFVTLGFHPIDVAFSGGGSLAYVTLLDGSRVFEVNMATGVVTDSTTFGARHHRILMAPGEDHYFVTSFDGKVYAVNRRSGRPVDSVALGGDIVRGIARSPETGHLVISRDYGTVTLLHAPTLSVIEESDLIGHAQEVVFSRDGKELFVALEDRGRVMVLDARTLAVRDSIVFAADPVAPFGMRLSGDGNTLLVSSPASGRIAVVDVPSLSVRRVLVPGGTPRRIALSPDGTLAFVSNEGGWIDVVH